MINISSVSALRTMPRALAFSGRRLLSSVPVVIRTCHAARPLGTALREAVCWDDRRAPSGCPARGMASYSGRGKPTRTREREREDQASTDSQTRNAPPLARRQQEETPYQDDERQPRQMDSLSDPGLKKFMVSIYATTGGCIGVAAVGSALPMIGLVPMLSPIIPGVAGIFVYLYLKFRTDQYTNPTKRTLLMGTCAGLTGMALTPMMLFYSSMSPMIVPAAFGMTCLLFGGSTVGALMMPKKSLMFLAPILGGGGLMMLGVCGAMIFYPSPLLHNIWLYAGLAMAMAFTAYDTQNAINGYEEGDRDHVGYSLDFFINFVMIFKRMLMMVGLMSGDD